MIETATFVCSICGEPSTEICVYCTKDTCVNHRCVRCKRCSDCCECGVALAEEDLLNAHEAEPVPAVHEQPPPPQPAAPEAAPDDIGLRPEDLPELFRPDPEPAAAPPATEPDSHKKEE